MDELLKVLEDKQLHVHQRTDDERLPNIPFCIQQSSTHYIMHGADIVYCGCLQGIRSFANQFKVKEKCDE